MNKLQATPIGNNISEVTERLSSKIRPVFSVTNDRGFVRSLDVFDKQVFSEDIANYKLVSQNDLAYNPSRINVGSIALYKEANSGAVSPMYCVVRCSSKLLPKYLLYFLKSDMGLAQIAQRCEGAVRFQLKFKDLQQIPIFMPSPDEQERIVHILDEVEVMGLLRTQANRRTSDLIPALFDEMFNEPSTNSKQFLKRPLGDLIKVKSGNGLTSEARESGHYPVYGGNGIAGYHSKYMFDDPVVVIGRVGAYCGVVHISLPKSWVTDNALYVSSFSNDLDLTYLTWALRFTNLNQYAGRAAQPLVSGSRIYPVEIVVPPKELQIEFAEHVKEYAEINDEQAKCGTRLYSLFESLLHRAFEGEL